jgi:hypothetical protein
MLAEFPELGPNFLVDEVLSHFTSAVLAWNAAGDDEALRHSFAYLEWLHEHGPPEQAARCLREFFGIGMVWPDAARSWLGPRTATALRDESWAPPGLVDDD